MKLQNATGNTEVRSSIDGVIQKIDTSKLSSEDGDEVSDDGTMDDSDMSSGASESDGSSGNGFITILSTGAYRVKGTVNELNIQNIVEGEPVIVRSRVDSTQTWKGTMGTIDKDTASSSNNNSYSSYSDSSDDSQTSSSTYPFYVNLDSSDGLMLGQHVYIEPDEGQEEKKAGLWLSEVYIVDADTENPYVWAANDKKKLEKRSVILGQYDENLGEYEIADGLSKSDYIAYPSDSIKEGQATTTNSEAADSVDMEPIEDSYTDDFSEDDFSEDDGSYDGVDEEYESDDDGTVIDDPEMLDEGDETEDYSYSDEDSEITDGDEDSLDTDLMPAEDDTEEEE